MFEHSAAAPAASALVGFGIPTLGVVTLLAVAYAIRRCEHGLRRSTWFTLAAVAWLTVTGVLAARGFFARFEAFPPPLVLLMFPTLALPLALGLSRVGRTLASQLPLAWLVGFHVFRLPLELVMHQAAVEGTMPHAMTFTGFNFDIVTGASAPLVALLLARTQLPRWLPLAWNALGTTLLLIIIAVAVASLPAFHAFGQEPAQLNTWVAYFPFAWLPAALVTSAIFGHVVLWRRLLGAHGKTLA